MTQVLTKFSISGKKDGSFPGILGHMTTLEPSLFDSHSTVRMIPKTFTI